MKNNSKKPVLPRKQLHRLARIASLLLKNTYPTPESLVKEFHDMELYKNLKVTCGIKTVLRDIKVLKDDFDCPIEYDRNMPGYYLRHHGWDFNCPTDLSETGMMTLLLGAKLAEDIFPDPIKGRMKGAVDEILKGNSPDFLDTTCLKSLIIFAESGVVDDSKVFPIVFEAWQTHRSLRITYDDLKGSVTERIVDPHVLFLYDKGWRIKAFCHLKNEPRTFVIGRIVQVELLKRTFKPEMKIIDSVTLDTLVGYRKIPEVKIRLTGDARKFALANKMHSLQTIHPEDSGNSWLFVIPEVPLEVVLPWILSQKGEAIPLSPQEVVEAVKAAAVKIASLC